MAARLSSDACFREAAAILAAAVPRAPQVAIPPGEKGGLAVVAGQLDWGITDSDDVIIEIEGAKVFA